MVYSWMSNKWVSYDLIDRFSDFILKSNKIQPLFKLKFNSRKIEILRLKFMHKYKKNWTLFFSFSVNLKNNIKAFSE